MLLDHRHVSQPFGFVFHVALLSRRCQVEWAESQIPKKRLKREYVFNDPQWTSMWYLVWAVKACRFS